MATYGRDFLGRWLVMVRGQVLGVYANREAARKAAEKWNAEHRG